MEIMNMEIITDAMTSDRADLGCRSNLSIPHWFGDQSAAQFGRAYQTIHHARLSVLANVASAPARQIRVEM
jgi:hypothetical protein